MHTYIRKKKKKIPKTLVAKATSVQQSRLLSYVGLAKPLMKELKVYFLFFICSSLTSHFFMQDGLNLDCVWFLFIFSFL